jgi:hypothetical protein
MTEPKFHIAQINIAAMRFALDHAEMTPFVAQLDRVNALADSAPGFVWRLQDDSGHATAIKAYADENILINMSVWPGIEDLFEYSYQSAHAEVLRGRKQWFTRLETAALALWWVRGGEIPSVPEGVARHDHLRQHGPSAHAFTFKQRFPPPPA